jgi:hypothetical protein
MRYLALKSMLVAAVVILIGVFAPRCSPGGAGVSWGGILISGCKVKPPPEWVKDGTSWNHKNW